MKYNYDITIFENGSFCWKFKKHEKTIEDYRNGEKFSLFMFSLILITSSLKMYFL